MSTQPINLLPTAPSINTDYVFPASNDGKTYKISVGLLSGWLYSKDISSQNSNYTITSGDKKSIVTFTNNGSTALEIPNNDSDSIPTGTIIDISNYNNTGSVKIVGAPGVVVNSALGSYVKNFGIAYLNKIETNRWILSGDLSPYQDTNFDNVNLLIKMTGTNNSTNFFDSSLWPKNISVSGADISTNNSKFGDSSGYFDIGDSLQISSHPDFNLSNKDFTLEFWANMSGYGNTGTGNILSISNNNTFSIKAHSGAYLLYANTGTVISSTTAPTLGSWTHIALSRNNQKLSIYINGILDKETTILSNTNYGSNNYLYIGAAPETSDSYHGYLNDIRLTTNKCRYMSNFGTPTEHLYSAQDTILPTGIPGLQLWLDANDSNTLYDAVVNGSLVPSNSGIFRWENKATNSNHATQLTSSYCPIRKTSIKNNKDAILFDGSNDYMNISSLPVDQRITAMIVWQPNNHSGYAYDTTYSSNDIDNRVALYNNSGLVSFAGSAITDTIYPLSGLWNLSTSVYDKTSSKLYINGILVSSGDIGTNNMDSLRIGTKNSLINYLNGYIGELLVYNYVMTETDRIMVEGQLKSKWGLSYQ